MKNLLTSMTACVFLFSGFPVSIFIKVDVDLVMQIKRLLLDMHQCIIYVRHDQTQSISLSP